jgi:hypothetical protein
VVVVVLGRAVIGSGVGMQALRGVAVVCLVAAAGMSRCSLTC